MSFLDPKTGMTLPDSARPVGVRCGYCPQIIFKQNEARGRLFMLEGRPICARCRILKTSRHANHIRHDKRKYDADVKARESHKEQKEIERVANIAVESQKRAQKIEHSESVADKKSFRL